MLIEMMLVEMKENVLICVNNFSNISKISIKINIYIYNNNYIII